MTSCQEQLTVVQNVIVVVIDEHQQLSRVGSDAVVAGIGQAGGD